MPEQEKAREKIDFRIKNDKWLIYLLSTLLILSILILFNTYKRSASHAQQVKSQAQTISNLEEEIASAARIKFVLRDALKKVVKKKRQREVVLQDEREKTAALNAQLADAQAEVAKHKKTIDGLTTDLNTLKVQHDELKKGSEALKEEKKALQEQFSSFQRVQQNLQKKISRLLKRTKVQLGEVVVKPSPLTGQIIKANKKYNFVIIDLGKNDGVQASMELNAYREDRLIGTIKIEKVYDELSVGKAAFEWTGDELAVGDAVRGKG